MVHLPRRAVEVRLDARRARLVQSSRGTNSARVSGIRDHGATSTTVQTEPEPVLARTWRSPSLSRLRSSAPGGEQLELAPGGLGQLDELEPELEHGSRQLGEPRCERDADAVGVGARLAQRQRPPPGAAADELRRERDLADEAVAPLGPCERRLDERAERAAQRQLVADRLGELERLRELGRRAAAAHARGRSASRQAPGAPAVRPQSFGDGATREPGKLSKLSHSERFELVVALPLERQQRERQRCEELPHLVVADDEQLPGLRDRGGRERGEPPACRADARIPVRADRGERALQRRVEAAVQPLDPARLEVRDAERGRLDREACVLERADDLLPGLLGRGRVGLDEHELRARRERLAEPHLRPDARPPPPPPSPGRAAALRRAPARAPPGAARGTARFRSAAFSSNPGMERQAIMGTYVLHEHTFSCQAPAANLLVPLDRRRSALVE